MVAFKHYDGTEHDHADIPPASLAALLSRASAHVYGNEVASQVVGFIRQQIAGANGKASEVSTDAVKVYREANPNVVANKTAEFQAQKKQAILDGTLGIRASGTSVSIDPLRREMLRLARDEIRQVFAARKWNGGKLPTGEATFRVNQIELDGAGWVARWLDESNDKMLGGKGEPNAARIERLAKRNLDAKAKAAQAATAAAATAEEVDGL